MVRKRLLDRRITSRVRVLLDDWLPPVVREWRPLNRVLARMVHGPNFDLDFKERAFHLTDREIAEAYDRLAQGGARFRDTDTTPASDDPKALVPRKRDPGPRFPWDRVLEAVDLQRRVPTPDT